MITPIRQVKTSGGRGIQTVIQLGFTSPSWSFMRYKGFPISTGFHTIFLWLGKTNKADFSVPGDKGIPVGAGIKRLMVPCFSLQPLQLSSYGKVLQAVKTKTYLWTSPSLTPFILMILFQFTYCPTYFSQSWVLYGVKGTVQRDFNSILWDKWIGLVLNKNCFWF